MFLQKYLLERLNEADLRQHVFIPLMEKMGLSGTFEWHGGPGELGKDIVCWKEDDLGSRRNTAIVAKARRISGKVSSASEVAAQVNQAFSTSV